MVITIESGERIQTLTLNRPHALNAFNDEMYKAIGDALSAAALDDDISVVIITGAGRAFSAGQDLGEMGDPKRREEGIVGQFGYFIKTVATFPKPLLAAVNGVGVGIGLTLLPHCDLVYMSKDARLRAPFASLGVTVEAGNSYLLPKVLGWANAADILFTGRWIDAESAKEVGLVFEVSEPDQLLDDVMAKASEIAALPLVSLVTTKKLMLAHRETGFTLARSLEDKAFARLSGAPANREAIAAFMEKRAADFSNLPEVP
ncbi:MAG: enoyl-CoA hydratase/isomerase family protein [Proteobacteria bacterium]|nr:enoyl-CoA hydratase/isomerase family protein [Pseudomonadota bacterium]